VHEIGIAQEVLKILENKAASFGPGAIKSVKLSVGALSGIVADSLQFALEVTSRGTRAEGMRVNITVIPARGKCRSCAHEWDFKPGQMECPACGVADISLSGGEELRVDSFEMDD
jgi:hydrogenase nickel incorporation protein HypA/HybF